MSSTLLSIRPSIVSGRYKAFNKYTWGERQKENKYRNTCRKEGERKREREKKEEGEEEEKEEKVGEKKRMGQMGEREREKRGERREEEGLLDQHHHKDRCLE